MKKNSSFSTNPTTNQKKTHKKHQKIKIKTPPLHQSHHRVKQQQYNTSHSTKSKAGSQCVKTNTSKSTNSNSDFLLCCLCVINVKIWSCGELNPRPLECKSSALPTELQPQLSPHSISPLSTQQSHHHGRNSCNLPGRDWGLRNNLYFLPSYKRFPTGTLFVCF